MKREEVEGKQPGSREGLQRASQRENWTEAGQGTLRNAAQSGQILFKFVTKTVNPAASLLPVIRLDARVRGSALDIIGACTRSGIAEDTVNGMCRLGLDSRPLLSRNVGTDPVGALGPSHAGALLGFLTNRDHVAEWWCQALHAAVARQQNRRSDRCPAHRRYGLSRWVDRQGLCRFPRRERSGVPASPASARSAPEGSRPWLGGKRCAPWPRIHRG